MHRAGRARAARRRHDVRFRYAFAGGRTARIPAGSRLDAPRNPSPV